MRKKSVPKNIINAIVKTQTRKNTIAANAAMYEFLWGKKPPRGGKKERLKGEVLNDFLFFSLGFKD